MQQFEHGRTLVERLLASPLPPVGDAKADLDALFNVAKTNGVVFKLAMMGFHADTKPQIQFDYSAHHFFPIIKLKP